MLSVGIVGTDFSGSSVVNAALGSLPGVFAAGETHWILDRDLGCRECGDECPVFTAATLARLRAGGPRNWWERLAALTPDDVVVSTDKNPTNYDRLGVPDLLVFLHKDAAATAYSRYRRLARDGGEGAEVLDKAVAWALNHTRRRLAWAQRTEREVLMLSLTDVAADTDGALQPLRERIGVPADATTARFWEADLHYIGGNFAIGPRGRQGGFEDGIVDGTAALDALPDALRERLLADERIALIREELAAQGG